MSRFVSKSSYVNVVAKHAVHVHGFVGVCKDSGYREE
jgi:hypothetical protein